jgi:hypothetical protein
MFTFCCMPSSGSHRSGRSKRSHSHKVPTVDIHCHISTPECEPLVKDLFSLEKEPFLFFASAETREINQRLFAEWASKLTAPDERLKDMDRMEIRVVDPLKRQWERGIYLGPESTAPVARRPRE